ncbi:unnamed protein product [Cuscuta epithymum]|uniref:Uncharacterized protein n=1 Tax=Cuscuta epithymum TaxID=186058 RepID=A0AAV0FZW4_9ASTE|nr:unnamed protein product [Cuscuta epithymum]
MQESYTNKNNQQKLNKLIMKIKNKQTVKLKNCFRTLTSPALHGGGSGGGQSNIIIASSAPCLQSRFVPAHSPMLRLCPSDLNDERHTRNSPPAARGTQPLTTI